MKHSVFLFLLSWGTFSLAQDLRPSRHIENQPRMNVRTPEARPVADGEDYKDEYFNANDLRALGAGSTVVLSLDKPFQIPANSRWAHIEKYNFPVTSRRVSQGQAYTVHTTDCYLVMRDADSRTREMTAGSRIIIGGGSPIKTKEGSKFAIEVPVESPASIKSIKCFTEQTVTTYPNKTALESTEEIRSPTNPEIRYLKSILLMTGGELTEAKPVPVD